MSIHLQELLLFIHCSPVHNLYKTSHPAVHLPCSHMKGETNGRNHHKPPCMSSKVSGRPQVQWISIRIFCCLARRTVSSGGASGKGVSS